MSMLTPRGVGGHAPVRRGRRRRRFLKVLLVLVLIGAIAVGGWYFLLRDESTTKTATAAATPTKSCPAPSSPPVALPAAQVRVNVFNGSERRGLAATVATELRKRGFKVAKVGNDPAKSTVAGVAEVRSGPRGTAAVHTVSAQVDDFVAVPDQRADASVDLVVGASFKALHTPVQAAAALQPTPEPKPTGC